MTNKNKIYLDYNGEECFFCQSRNINIFDTEKEKTPGTIIEHMECHDCGKSWQAHFILKKVTT